MQLSIFVCLSTERNAGDKGRPVAICIAMVGSSGLDTTNELAYVRSHLAPLAAYTAMVGSSGLEPPTSRLSGVCSNQLSYEPVMVEVSGFEPLTPCLQGRCSTS